jgi:hypothetical protein
MIVPTHDPRRRRVRGDEIPVGLVESVAISIVNERVDFLTVVLADAIAAPTVAAAFVDVVAGVKHEVEPLLGDPSKCGEVSGLVVIAAADGKPQPIDRGVRRRRGLGSPDWLTSSPARNR